MEFAQMGARLLASELELLIPDVKDKRWDS